VTLTIVFSLRDVAGTIGEEKYYALIFILTGMVIGLVCANDLFNLWVWFEGTAISSYLLVGFYRERENTLAACIKYFIQTASSSVFILFGIALVFLHTGTLTLSAMQATPNPLIIIAGVLFVAGFGVKAALFPSYTWLPDAYAESPTGISALLSGVVTISALIALLKVLSIVIWSTTAWGILLLTIALSNIVIGNVLALTQTQIKRVLAYSSISHIGFILLAVGIGIITQDMLGLRGAVLHVFIHGLMKSCAFFIIGAFAFVLGRHQTTHLTIQDLNGVAQRYPIIGFALVMALLSLAGMPLLAGFISKWQIFIAGIYSQSIWLTVVVVFAAINSVFSLAYYLPIINALYNTEVHEHWTNAPDIPLSMRIPIVVLALSLLVLGIMPGLIDGLINPATSTLFALFGGG
jgi:proton-translocating NADH-quinone oxidoreductase chain N